MKVKKYAMPIIIILALILGFFIFRQDKLSKEKTIGLPLDNPLLLYFNEKVDKEVLKCEYEDVTGDGRKDLIVIYKISARSNGMVVIIDTEEGYRMTKEVPAPIDNQTIEFKNIDDEEPMEFIVSGSKDGRFGYAIFRIKNMEIKDLFGEGMEDCC